MWTRRPPRASAAALRAGLLRAGLPLLLGLLALLAQSRQSGRDPAKGLGDFAPMQVVEEKERSALDFPPRRRSPLSELVSGGSSGFGFIFHGALFLTEARITLNYLPHDGNTKVYVDIFGLPRHKLNWNLVCPQRNVSCEAWRGLLPWSEAALHIRGCAAENGKTIVHGRIQSVPVLTSDWNRINLIHIWRCNLGQFPVSGKREVHLVLKNNASAIQALKIPTNNQVIDLAHSSKLNARGGLITLCVGGIRTNGIQLVSHFIRHHLKVGVDRFVLGLYFLPNGQAHRDLVTRLGPLLTNGTVSLMFLAKLLRVITAYDALEYFHTSCLYQAKSLGSLHVGCWDIDEWWFPAAVNASQEALAGSLARVLESLRPREFCYVTFPSYIMHGHDAFWGMNKSRLLPRTGNPQRDFKFRDGNTNWVYRKSIARTQNAFLATSHVFGSCRGQLPETFVMPAVVAMRDNCWDSHCAVSVPDLGIMRHYYPIFHHDNDLWKVGRFNNGAPQLGPPLLPHRVVTKWSVDKIVRDEFAL